MALLDCILYGRNRDWRARLLQNMCSSDWRAHDLTCAPRRATINLTKSLSKPTSLTLLHFVIHTVAILFPSLHFNSSSITLETLISPPGRSNGHRPYPDNLRDRKNVSVAPMDPFGHNMMMPGELVLVAHSRKIDEMWYMITKLHNPDGG